ncbi:hypothetical protein ES703_83187 [subsurface metagenome]
MSGEIFCCSAIAIFNPVSVETDKENQNGNINGKGNKIQESSAFVSPYISKCHSKKMHSLTFFYINGDEGLSPVAILLLGVRDIMPLEEK